LLTAEKEKKKKMALNYSQLVTASSDTTFRNRVKAAINVAAIAITVDAPSTPLDLKRDKLARQVLNNPTIFTDSFALPVALGFTAKSALDLSDATDAELDTRVAAVWNDLIP
jgi:hypothetical protein